MKFYVIELRKKLYSDKFQRIIQGKFKHYENAAARAYQLSNLGLRAVIEQRPR